MNLEQIVKETVAKMVDEKTLTAAEKKKKEEIVMAMKKDFKGPEAALYAIATDKAKKLAEDGLNEDYEVAMAQDSLDSIIRAAMMLKAQMGDQEVNLPAWIQDHITNSENYINQAAKGYHESTAQTGAEDQSMDEANLGHNETSSIEQEGRFWVVTYQTSNGTKEKSFESEDEARAFYNTLDEAFKPKSSFDDYKIGDNVTVSGKKAKITNMKMDDETGERRARVRFEDGSAKEVSINSLDENTMTTNEGRSAEDLKQAQLEKAYDHLEKMKANTRLFSKEDIKKAEDRIEKLEAELDALAAKATNEALDEVKHPMFDKLVKQYISKGYSEENAKKQAAADINAGDKSGERSEKSTFNYNKSQELDESQQELDDNIHKDKSQKNRFLGIFGPSKDVFQRVIKNVSPSEIENLIKYTESNGDEVERVGNNAWGITKESDKNNQSVWQYLDGKLLFINPNHPSVYDDYISTGLNKSLEQNQQGLDEWTIRRMQHYAGIK